MQEKDILLKESQIFLKEGNCFSFPYFQWNDIKQSFVFFGLGILIEFYESLSCPGEEFPHIHFYLKYLPLNTFVAKVQRIWQGQVVKLWEFEEQTDVKHNFLLRQKLGGIERCCQKTLFMGLELIINVLKIMHRIVFYVVYVCLWY